jgi:UDP-N-acetylglucosamine 4,6-dehydratase
MNGIEGKIILVTGGTGSFGLFIVHRLLGMGPAEIRLFSRDEKKHYDLRLQYKGEDRIKFITGDIRDADRVRQVMRGCDVVFQAAALKHVNNCEDHPFEAVKTNVIGVQNVIDSSIEFGVERFVTVSTDKAVKPVNVMGMTKAVQERLVIAANRLPGNKKTRFSCVRYGNVMSSRGSAIPFFRELAQDKKPITLTDTRMTRFLLTLDDAIDLVMYAVQNMAGGEIYIKKAPSTRIMDLARVICEDNNVKFRHEVIGMFPGEKLHEILITEEEMPRAREQKGYFVVNPWWNPERFTEVSSEFSSENHLLNSDSDIRALLKKSDDEFEKFGLKRSVFLK